VDEREGCGIQLSDGTILVHVFVNKLYRSRRAVQLLWARDVRFSHEIAPSRNLHHRIQR
jgi:hypothetical protein